MAKEQQTPTTPAQSGAPSLVDGLGFRVIKDTVFIRKCLKPEGLGAGLIRADYARENSYWGDVLGVGPDVKGDIRKGDKVYVDEFGTEGRIRDYPYDDAGVLKIVDEQKLKLIWIGSDR